MQRIAFVVSLLGAYTQAVGDGSYDSRVKYTDAGKSWEGTCSTGKSQSPIKLSTDMTTKFATGGYHLRGGDFGTLNSAEGKRSSWEGWNYLDLQYKGFISLDVDEENADGVMERVEGSYRPLMEKVKKSYRPLRMDFKSPAEHWIPAGEDGAAKQLDLEVQISLAEQDPLVGNAEAQAAAVLSVFFQAGDQAGGENNKYVDALQASSKTKNVDEFDLNAFLNDFSVDQYYVYEGSLTEPPCTEGVRWILLPDVKEMSQAQKTTMDGLWKNVSQGLTNRKYENGNARATQELNDRKVNLGNNFFESTASMVSTAAIFTTASIIALSSF